MSKPPAGHVAPRIAVTSPAPTFPFCATQRIPTAGERGGGASIVDVTCACKVRIGFPCGGLFAAASLHAAMLLARSAGRIPSSFSLFIVGSLQLLGALGHASRGSQEPQGQHAPY